MKKLSLALALLAFTLPALAPASARADEPERVVMKLDEFLKLYEANKALAEAEKAPRDYAIASATRRTAPGRPNSALHTVPVPGWSK